MKMKMKKLTHVHVWWMFILGAVFIPIIIYFIAGQESIKIFGDTLYSDGDTRWGFLHLFYMTVLIIGYLIYCLLAICLLSNEWSPNFYKPRDKYNSCRDENDSGSTYQFNFKKYTKIAIAVICVILLFKFTARTIDQLAKMYNTSKLYHNQYIQKVQEKQGFYDKLWKTYLQKEKITNLNKDVFIQVSKIIMENRRDGQELTWKWVHENQNIKYEEFTKFYMDLSLFIEAQREGYFSIEQSCQKISMSNNTLLDTFPNNFYNKILKCQKINFEYGFLSDKTDSVFTSKNENVQ